MALGLSGGVVLALCVILPACLSDDFHCSSYEDEYGVTHSLQLCRKGFCCGHCYHRYCCKNKYDKLSESQQEECDERVHFMATPVVLAIAGTVCASLILICCFVCPYCCLYKACCKPRPVIATTTHTTVVTGTPRHYPQQATATPTQPQSYQGAPYPSYQPVPVQPGYGTQPTMPNQGQSFTPGPPPTYQEAIGPGYSPNPMPYSQAAYAPGQPAYPLQPPVNPQPNAPPVHPDFLTQPAYNPDYVAPRTG